MAAPFIEPNLYQLQGHYLHITYSTTGMDAKPHFHYQDENQTLDFDGDQIHTMSTDIGTLVTVFIRRTVDTGATTFTLLVPHVNLDQTRHAHIATEGVTTVHRFSIFPPANQGQTELYAVTHLTGTASAVVF